MKEGAPAPTLAPEIVPTLSIESRDAPFEWRVLRRERPWAHCTISDGITLPASSCKALIVGNPIGSGVLTVVQAWEAGIWLEAANETTVVNAAFYVAYFVAREALVFPTGYVGINNTNTMCIRDGRSALLPLNAAMTTQVWVGPDEARADCLNFRPALSSCIITGKRVQRASGVVGGGRSNEDFFHTNMEVLLKPGDAIVHNFETREEDISGTMQVYVSGWGYERAIEESELTPGV